MNKPVADVGLFHTSKATYNKDTHNVLKVLMNEAKFSNSQRKDLDNNFRNSNPLPQKATKKPAKQPSNLTHLNPKNYKGSRRTQAQILSAESYLREQYQPPIETKYGGGYEREKDRLRSMMTYGEDLKAKAEQERMKEKFQNSNTSKPTNDRKNKHEEKDRFLELQEEIADRQNFLDEMQKCGRADEHRNRINTEISQMIREMEIIDKERNKKLEELKREKLK